MTRVNACERIRRADRPEALFNYAVKNNDVVVSDDHKAIKERAMAAFEARLSAKLKNLQDGEHLSVIFEIDIIGRNGKVRGGSGSERTMPEYATWRKAVYERDGFKCVDCGASEKLNAHHIKSWSRHPDLRFDVDNGETLCFSCHALRHPHLKFISD